MGGRSGCWEGGWCRPQSCWPDEEERRGVQGGVHGLQAEPGERGEGHYLGSPSQVRGRGRGKTALACITGSHSIRLSSHFTSGETGVCAFNHLLSDTPALRYAAGPYQKEAAIRGAEQAIRPWAPPPAGLGERAGAAMAQYGPASLAPESQGMHQGMMSPQRSPEGRQQAAEEGRMQPLGAPLYQPSPQAAAAIGQAAGRVARPGTAQVDAPDAWSAVPHEMGRQIWPSDIIHPPRYCVGCRGELL